MVLFSAVYLFIYWFALELTLFSINTKTEEEEEKQFGGHLMDAIRSTAGAHSELDR